MKKTPAALAVASGILLSRLFGLLRERIFAYYLGNSDAAGAFRAALRIPNLLQNLFGEGVLSASFIPVYSKLLAEGKEAEASRLASILFSLLTAGITILVAVGIFFSDALIGILAPGFQGEVRTLTIQLVRLLFPGVGLLVLSAWCLGVLNSHHKFFLSYFAPVLWNGAIIVALIVGGFRGEENLVVWVAIAAGLGSALQFLVQLPFAIRLNNGLKPEFNFSLESVKKVTLHFIPAVMTRGIIQISAYLDQIFASFLGPAAVSAFAYAQTLYTLPVSLFGMAISASELPAMAKTLGTEAEIKTALNARLVAGLRRLAFYVVPSTVAFILLGDIVTSTLFQTGRFGLGDAHYVWFILAGSAIGLLPSTQSRLCVSTYWALGNVKTPMWIASIRVALSAGLSALLIFYLREKYQWDLMTSSYLLTALASIVATAEYLLLQKLLKKRVGKFGLGWHSLLSCWGAALLSGLFVYFLKKQIPMFQVSLRGICLLALYGLIYIALLLLTKNAQAQEFMGRLTRRSNNS